MKFGHHMMTWDGWWQKNKLPHDLAAFLKEAKQAGYDAVELGGTVESLGTPAELRQRVADAGLQIAAFASGVTANPYEPNTQQYQADLRYAAAAGVQTVVVCGGFMPEQRRNTFDSDYQLFADNLGAACTYAHQQGVEIAFHPHCGCIVETMDETERLLRLLPDLKLCVDTGHLAAVRNDPVVFIRRYGTRVTHCHLKDWDPTIRKFTELGQGKAGVDFAAILKAFKDTKFQGWIVVERDAPQMPAIESARISREFLAKMAG